LLLDESGIQPAWLGVHGDSGNPHLQIGAH
jgi:hypothetical protein